MGVLFVILLRLVTYEDIGSYLRVRDYSDVCFFYEVALILVKVINLGIVCIFRDGVVSFLYRYFY